MEGAAGHLRVVEAVFEVELGEDTAAIRLVPPVQVAHRIPIPVQRLRHHTLVRPAVNTVVRRVVHPAEEREHRVHRGMSGSTATGLKFMEVRLVATTLEVLLGEKCIDRRSLRGDMQGIPAGGPTAVRVPIAPR